MNPHDAPPPDTACGMFAIVGRANVGKSTLLNALVGHKLSITSRKPQTTRYRLLGVRTEGARQFVYVDTPGLQLRPRRGLNRSMNREVIRALADVDAAVLVTEALVWSAADEHVLRQLRAAGATLIVAVNKIDRIKDKPRLLPFLERLSAAAPGAPIVPLSARTGDGLEPLQRCLGAHLRPGPLLFPDDAVTDRSERFLVAEIVREKLIRRLGDELPYSISVITEQFVERRQHTRIAVAIWVEKRSQKPVVIGRDGQVLKEIGIMARRDMETLLGRPVHLDTWVKVREHWADDARALLQLGFEA